MQLDLLMALTLARLQQCGAVPVDANTPTTTAGASSSALVVSAVSSSSSASSSSSSSSASDDDQLNTLPAERLLRPALVGRLLGAGATAVAFGQRMDHARASWLAAAHWLAQRIAPSFPREFDDDEDDKNKSNVSGAGSASAGKSLSGTAKSALSTSLSSSSTSSSSSSVLPSAAAQTLAQCTVFFLLQATRALDQDASFARRLDALSAAAGGALAKLTAAEAAQVQYIRHQQWQWRMLSIFILLHRSDRIHVPVEYQRHVDCVSKQR
jgi:hypothetical protein